MTKRYKATPAGNIELNAAELAEVDQRERDFAAGEAKRAKDTANAEIIRKLDAIDRRRIRPLAEGDTVVLDALNAEAVALRAQLVK